MPDEPFIPLTPSQLVQIISGSAGPLGSTKTPANIAGLNLSALLGGVITGRDNNGNPILRTPQGELTLNHSPFLTVGSKVILKFDTSNPATPQARIISVDGVPLEKLQKPAAEPEYILSTTQRQESAKQPLAERLPTYERPAALPASQGQTATLKPESTSLPLARGAEVEALLARPEPRSGNIITAQLAAPSAAPNTLATATARAPAAIPESLPAGSSFNIRILTLTPPSSSGTTAPAAGTVTAAYTALAATETLLPQTAAQSSAQSAALPASSPPAPIQPGAPLNATVTSIDRATGEPVLSSPLGELRLPPGTNAAPGTQFTFQVTKLVSLPAVAASPQGSASTTALPALGDAPADTTTLAHQWDSMKTLLASLQQANPQAAQHFIAHALPQPGSGIAGSLFYFMLTLQGGDVRRWIGEETARFLEQSGKGNLLARLGLEFASIRQVFTATQDSPWQMLFFPVFDGQELSQARLYIRRDDQGKKRKKGEPGSTRFVVEVELTQLGELQMDGFFKEASSARAFDLVIRSHDMLPTEITEDIARIFTDALATSTVQGTLRFEITPTFPIDPLEEVVQQHPQVLVV